MSRAAQSLFFALIYSIYLVAVMEPIQWLLIRPLKALLPRRRDAIQRAWMRGQARWVLGLARSLGGMRLEVQGSLPETSCVVVMNHQSLLDIPVAVALMPGPAPLIPTRASYRYGFPGISQLLRMDTHPFVSQGERATRAEHRALAAAADRVARGERSILLYPEGHRSRDGELQPFMTPGLELILRRAHDRPVYIVVVDGLWSLRSFGDLALRIAGTRARVAVRGPFARPTSEEQRRQFVDHLHDEMLAMLDGLREPAAESVPSTSAHARARYAG